MPVKLNVINAPAVAAAPRQRAAMAVEVTGNLKTGPVSVSSASQSSCPDTCPAKNRWCYAEGGRMAMVKTGRLNASPVKDKTAIAQEEANAIDTLTGRRPLRIHDVGDCDSEEAARIIAAAAKRYKERGGIDAPVWTYTHSRNVRREAWGDDVSIFQSCETEEQIQDAFKRGYAACIEFAGDFPSNKLFTLPKGTRVMPCPQQTGRKENCIACGLCFRSEALLKSRTAIGFKGHGQKRKLMAADCEF